MSYLIKFTLEFRNQMITEDISKATSKNNYTKNYFQLIK